MNRSHIPYLVTFIGSIALLFLMPLQSAATTFSGRVIDEAGHPIAGLTIVLVPVQDGRGAWFPIEVDGREGHDDPIAFQAETDSEGRFVITDAIAGPVLLGLFPYYKPEAQILRVQIGEMYLYPGGNGVGGGTVLALEPGEYIENVEITVQQFLQLRGKVLKTDGNPLANAQRVKFRVRRLSLDAELDSSTSWTTETDAEGNFVQYIPAYVDGPMFYFMSITCGDGSAQLDPIVVKPEDLMHEAVFMFEDPLIPDVPRNVPGRFHAGVSARAGGGLDTKGVWVVNPENGHAYKKIRFGGTENAISQAAKEGAYLVAINDAAEQQWLERVFSPMRTLIGLSDIEEEGQWQWHSGEPVTYTNWAKYEPQDTDKGDEDYVILVGDKWMDIGPGDVRWGFIQSALLEKEGVPLKK
jgi:hypothetical protein